MTRRALLGTGIASTLISVTPGLGDTQEGKVLLGGAPTSFSVRAKAAREKKERFDVIEHCHQLGLAGAESSLVSPTPEAVKRIRKQVDDYNMVVILNTPLPKSSNDVAAFDSAVAACKEAGAIALHAAMTQRRYEQFHSLADFKANFAQCKQSIALAEPVLQKHRMRLAIENHKGWRAGEQAKWLGQVSSEWVGVCLDMGNNFSLCETPDETFAALTSFAIFSHIKDMGLQDYPDGFLLSEVVFGDGVIDLKERVAQLRRKDAKMLFCLEMITRDPLKIPVFTDEYWSTFSDSETQIPAQDLAKVLRMVRQNSPKKPLPAIDGLSTEKAIELEDENNLACIRYARQNLNM